MKVLINLLQTVSCTVETYELALGLVENGVDVSLILSKHVENLSEWKKVENIFSKVYYVDTATSRKNQIQKTIWFFLFEEKKIKRVFREDTYDFLINPMVGYIDTLLFPLIRANQVVTYIHDPIPHSGVRWWLPYLRTYQFKRADQVIVHTKSFIPIVMERYGYTEEAVHFVPHGRLSNYKEVWKKEPYDNVYIGRTNFVFFGLIRKYKGLHVLAEAYKILEEKGFTVTLTIAGGGDFSEYEEEYKRLHNVIIYNRRIKDEEIGNLFSLPNAVTVLPYLDATQSGVVVTSMEFKTPIIASDVGGLKEQMNDGKIGLFFEAGNAEELAERMIYIIEHPDERTRQQELMSEYIHTLDRTKIAKCLIDELSKSSKNATNVKNSLQMEG